MKKEVKEVQKEQPSNFIFICRTEEKKNKKTLADCIKFGFGFYVGYNVARTLKHLVIRKLSK